MINVLIAEDELLIRMGLESSVPWHEMGFHVVAVSSDGQKAWETYQRYHPQVLITDIRMPRLDGIELIKRIRQVDSLCKIIVITCIEYFDVMYQSFDFNITGYLLKASMTHNQLYQLLSQIKKELNSSCLPSSESLLNDLSTDERMRMFLVDRSISLSELIASTPGILINFSEQIYLLIVCCGYVNKALFQSVTGAIREELSTIGELLVICGDDRIYFLIHSPQSVTFTEISRIMNNISAYMKNIFALPLRYSFTTVGKLNALQHMADLCNHFIDQSYFFPEQGTFVNGNSPYLAPFTVIEQLRNNLACYAFMEGETANYYSSLLDAVKHSYGTDKTIFLKNFAELLAFLSDFCFSPPKKESLDSFAVDSFDNAPEALKTLQDIVPNYSPNPLYASEMLKSIHYIHQNYRESLSISQLAAILNVSPNYYAILFRKTTDSNFTDFLMGLRLYHSRRMLRETTLSIAQIAEHCGFSDAAYFSKVFKHTYRITPRQYRRLA